jgi:hypothetical protein
MTETLGRYDTSERSPPEAPEDKANLSYLLSEG